MAQIIYASTASFCVENARELGIPAAILLDKIVRLSPHTPRKDGFCWYTAKDFEMETSLKKDAFAQAVKKLEEAGIIEKKVTYVLGTMERATHFKLTATSIEPKSESGFDRTSSESGFDPLSVNTIKYNKGDTEIAKAISSPQSSLGSAPKEVVEDFPVGAEEQKVSVRPNKKEADPAKRCWAVAKQVLEAWGYRAPKVSSVLAGKVKTWLDAGFSPEQIIEAGGMMKENGDEYWKSATPIQMLSENGLLWYQTNRKKILLDKIPHAEMCGKLYQIDPKTGGIVKEIKL